MHLWSLTNPFEGWTSWWRYVTFSISSFTPWWRRFQLTTSYFTVLLFVCFVCVTPGRPLNTVYTGEGFWMLWLLASYWTLMTCSSMPWPQHQDGTWSINWMPCPCQPCRAFAEPMPNQCLGGCCPLAVRWNMLKQSFILSMWLYSARNLQLSGSSFVAHLCTQSATDRIQAKHPLQ